MKKSKNKKLLDDFIKYCSAHPELRFWQSLCSWAKVSSVWIGRYDEEIDDERFTDTFYFLGKNK